MDDFQRKTGTWDEQVVRLASPSSLSLNLVVYHFACRLFLIIGHDIFCSAFLFLLECIPIKSLIVQWCFFTWNAGWRFEKSSRPSSPAFISTYFFSPIYLSGNDKSSFGPKSLCGLVASSGYQRCQRARKSKLALRYCQ